MDTDISKTSVTLQYTEELCVRNHNSHNLFLLSVSFTVINGAQVLVMFSVCGTV
jgi:hypothetical protein